MTARRARHRPCCCLLAAGRLRSAARRSATATSSSVAIRTRARTTSIRARPTTRPRSASAQLVFSSLMDIGHDLRVRPHLAAAARQPRPAHLRRAPAPRRAVPRRARADVEGRGLHLRGVSRSRPTSRRSRAHSACCESVRALDDYTVEFKLKEPFAAFPAQLVGCRRSCRPARATRCARFPIGTGPVPLRQLRARTISRRCRRSRATSTGCRTTPASC